MTLRRESLAGPELPGALGRYVILERVGSGGFGSVYRARDPESGRIVAVKTCEAIRPDLRTRFFREASLASRLSHPNIVAVLEFCPDEGVPFLVEEFVEGEDLSALIRRGEPSSLAARLRILEEVADGLDHAHALGVVHRDVKPGNVRVTSDGHARILDFGIAKSLDPDSTMTRPDVTLGSVGYMSPEQLEGRPLDHRTDIFSLGVLAYETLSGARPFAAPTLARLFQQVVHESPERLRRRAPAVPPGVEALVHSALEKNPADRPERASEFRDGVRAVRRELGAGR